MCKGSNTTTQQSANTTTSAPNPQAMQLYSDLLSRAQGVANTPYNPYPGELVAPVNQQQQLGIANINSTLPTAAGMAYNAAQPLTTQQIQQYQSPYIQGVVNATQNQFNNQNAQQQAQLTGNAISQGALGGNRVGVAQAQLAGQQQLAQAPVIANLMNTGYNTGVNTALTQQQALASGASNLSNIGLAGANAQIGAGSLQQQTQQAQDTAAYQQFLQQMAYPFQTTQWLAGLGTGVGSQMGGTTMSNGQASTTGPAPSPFSQIFGGLSTAGGLLGASGAFGSAGWLPALFAMSDERAKENIVPVGRLFDGQMVYRFNYKGDHRPQIGLIAQEVEKTHPEAVGVADNGLLAVNYDQATRDAAQGSDQDDDSGVANRADGGQLSAMPFGGASGYIPSALEIKYGQGAPRAADLHYPQLPGQQQNDASKQTKGIADLGKGLFDSFGSQKNSFGDPVFTSDDDSMSGAGLSADEDNPSMYRRGGSVGVAGFDAGGAPDDGSYDEFGPTYYTATNPPKADTPPHDPSSDPDPNAGVAPAEAPPPPPSDDLSGYEPSEGWGATGVAPPAASEPNPLTERQSQNAVTWSIPSNRSAIAQEVLSAANKYGIPPQIALNLAKQESGFNQDAISKAGAIGVTQLMPDTARELGVDPYNPIQNINGGMRYLAQQYQKYGDWGLALAAYNAGPRRVDDYVAGKGPLPAETRNYVPSILGGGDLTNDPALKAETNGVAPTDVSSVRRGVGRFAAPDHQEGGVDWGANSKIWPTLMAAGLGMMASRSPFPGVAIGEGGLQGLATYQGMKAAEQSRAMQERKMELEARRLDAQLGHQRVMETQGQQRLNMDMIVPVPGYETKDGHPVGIDKRHSGQMIDLTTGKPAEVGEGLTNTKLQWKPLPNKTTENGSPIFVNGQGQMKEAGSDRLLGPNDKVVDVKDVQLSSADKASRGYMLALGDTKGAYSGLGFGQAGNKAKNAVYQEAAQQLRAVGMSDKEVGEYLSNQSQEFAAKGVGLNAEARTAANREANLKLILKATDAAIPAALEASEEMARTRWTPLNRIIEKGRVIASDPAAYKFGMANLQLAEHWARAMNPTGVMRESDRDLALHYLDTAAGPEAYKQVVQQLKVQIEREKTAVDNFKKEYGSSNPMGKTDGLTADDARRNLQKAGPAAAPAPASAPTAPAATAAPAKAEAPKPEQVVREYKGRKVLYEKQPDGTMKAIRYVE